MKWISKDCVHGIKHHMMSFYLIIVPKIILNIGEGLKRFIMDLN
jgi:hypothetical protein